MIQQVASGLLSYLNCIELPSAHPMKSEAGSPEASFNPFGCRWYVEMTIEQEVSYGLDFAFEFALTNPLRTPPSADNAADPGVSRGCVLLNNEFTCMLSETWMSMRT